MRNKCLFIEKDKLKKGSKTEAQNTTVLNECGGKRRAGLFLLAAGLPVATIRIGSDRTGEEEEEEKEEKE